MGRSIRIAYNRRDASLPYLLLIPALAVAGIVLVYPLVNGILLSFTDYTIIRPVSRFVGIQNYINQFTNPVYWEIFGNSIVMVFTSVFFQVSIGLGMALLLNSALPLREVFRSLVFMIWIMPMIVVSLLWLVMFNSDFGIVNYILERLGLIGSFISWFGEPVAAKITIILAYMWRGTPFFMVMLLAALQTIPDSIIDAAKIDGAGGFQRFLHIIIPSIVEILILTSILSIVRLFQNIIFIQTLTGGGPLNATTTLAIEVYKKAFVSFRMGEASAIGVTWLLFLFFIGYFYLRIVTKREFQR